MIDTFFFICGGPFMGYAGLLLAMLSTMGLHLKMGFENFYIIKHKCLLIMCNMGIYNC